MYKFGGKKKINSVVAALACSGSGKREYVSKLMFLIQYYLLQVFI